MYPNKMTYGAWPNSGELDVAEWWSNAPQTVLPSLIYNGSDYSADSGWNCTVTDPSAWHTYAVVWLDWRMQFSIDGQACFTRSWTPKAPQKAPQPFDQPFALVLTMAADNSRTNSPDSSTKFPATYEVDYARAWQ